MILAFDLKSEKFYEVQQPHGMKGGFCSQVGVLRGCLWINSYYHDEPRCDIWVMKEYGSIFPLFFAAGRTMQSLNYQLEALLDQGCEQHTWICCCEVIGA